MIAIAIAIAIDIASGTWIAVRVSLLASRICPPRYDSTISRIRGSQEDEGDESDGGDSASVVRRKSSFRSCWGDSAATAPQPPPANAARPAGKALRLYESAGVAGIEHCQARVQGVRVGALLQEMTSFHQRRAGGVSGSITLPLVATWRDTAPRQVQDDLDGLVSTALDAAMSLLTKNGEFLSFGVTVSEGGDTAIAAADPGLGERPDSTAVLESLYVGVRGNGTVLRAAGFVADVRANGGDAVRVEAEHRVGGPALVVLMPYARKGLVKKSVAYGQMTAWRRAASGLAAEVVDVNR